MKCPECGCTISDNVEFCPGCGQPVRTKTIYPGKAHVKALSVRCPWCGEMIPPGKKSCPNCGSPAKVTYDTHTEEHVPYVRRRPSRDDDWEWHPSSGGQSGQKRPSVWLFILIALVIAAFTILAIRTIRSMPRRGETPAEASVIFGGYAATDAMFAFPD